MDEIEGTMRLKNITHRNAGSAHLLKGLSYFEDADRNPEPLLLNKGVKWDEVKRFFLNNIQEFERAFSRVKDF
jgi:hypothetical protein